MTARRRVAVPVGASRLELPSAARKLPLEPLQRSLEDETRLLLARGLHRRRRAAAGGGLGSERRRQCDRAPERGLQPAARAEDARERLVREACDRVRERPGDREPRLDRGDERQQERRLELVARDPEAAARFARDDRRQVHEDRLRVPEQHVCGRRVLQLPAARQERTRQCERERARGGQHFRRPFGGLADKRDSLVLEALAVEVGELRRRLDARQRARADDAALVHPAAHDGILEHAPECLERVAAHGAHQAAFILDECGVGIAERPRARGSRDQRGSPGGGSETSSAAGASRRVKKDMSFRRNSRK